MAPLDPAGETENNGASRQSKVEELVEHAGVITPAPLFPLPPMESAPSAVTRNQNVGARQPDKYGQWAHDKFMKALEAPEMVAAFHGGKTLEIPSTERTQSGGRAGVLGAELSGSQQVRLRPPASPYTVMTAV